MALNASLNKATYNEGEDMVLTVTTDAGERDQFALTPVSVLVSVPGVGDAEATAQLRRQVGTAPVTVVDATRAWAPGKDDGTTAVFTTKA